MLKKSMILAAVLLGVLPFSARAEEAAPSMPKPAYSIALQGQDQSTVGAALIAPAPKGVMLLVDIYNLPKGWHAIHFHGTGDCSDHADHFKKSGGHAQLDGQEHGFFNPKGPHSGDLPNFYVGDNGRAEFHVYSTDITEAQLTDADGAALVIHANPDDYASAPAGNAGDRLACGPVVKIPLKKGAAE